jgi:hypothetical protein
MRTIAFVLAVLGGLTLLSSAGLFVLGVLPSLDTHGSLIPLARGVLYAALGIAAGGIVAAVRAKSLAAIVLNGLWMGLPLGMMIARAVLTES